MTNKLYYEDSHLITFEASVLSCEPKDHFFHVVLDSSAFFPEGGGQAGDTGILITPDETKILVLDTHEKNDIIYHKTKEPLEPGCRVIGRIDWEKRFDRMQQHSGEHLISGLVNQKYGYDNVGFHLGDQEVTLDFNGVLDKEQLAEIELLANKAVAANFPVIISYPDKETLSNLTYRSKIEIAGQVRIVEYPGYDVCACCAPHVNHTGEIGMIKITHVQNHRGGIRVNILCGLRALEDYREKDSSVKKISVLLSAKEALVSDAVSRLKEEQFHTQGRLMKLQEQILNRELENLSKDSRDVIYFFDELDANAVREFVNKLMERCQGYCAVFFGTEENGYKYIIGSKSEDIRPLGKSFNTALNGRGGGKAEMIQGSVTASRQAIRQTLLR